MQCAAGTAVASIRGRRDSVQLQPMFSVDGFGSQEKEQLNVTK